MDEDKPALLKIQRLTKRFGGLVALRNVDFDVRASEILGLIGPNGAGKTTVLNIVSGIYRPDVGEVWFDEQEITGWSPEQICHGGIGRTFQIAQSFPNLTVEQNVHVAALFGKGNSGKPPQETLAQAQRVLEDVGLGAERDAPAKSLTVGELKKLELARALATQPRLLLLDEILTGLNLDQISEALELVRKIRDQGIAVMIVEHNMRAVMSLCGRLVVLNYGEKIADGTPDEVASQKSVVTAYLGERAT